MSAEESHLLSRLPADLLCNALRYLNSRELFALPPLVCRELRDLAAQAARSATLWTPVDRYFWADYFDVRKSPAFHLRPPPEVFSLSRNLTSDQYVREQTVVLAFLKLCPRIKDIGYFAMSSKFFRAVAEELDECQPLALEDVNFDLNSWPDDEYDEGAFRSFVKRLSARDVRSLSVRTSLFQVSHKLEILSHISESVRTLHVEILFPQKVFEIGSLAKRFPYVERFYIACDDISLEDFAMLSETWTNLSVLGFSAERDLCEYFTALGPKFSKVKHLITAPSVFKLEACKEMLEDESLFALMENFTVLNLDFGAINRLYMDRTLAHEPDLCVLRQVNARSDIHNRSTVSIGICEVPSQFAFNLRVVLAHVERINDAGSVWRVKGQI